MNVWVMTATTCRLQPHTWAPLAVLLLALGCAQTPIPQSSSGSNDAGTGTTSQGQQTPQSSNNVLNLPPTPTATSPNQPTATTNPNGAMANQGGNGATLPTNGNTPIPNGNDTVITAIKPIASPAIGFDGIPRKDNKAIALTFDDGPDGAQGATDLVLDVLKKENLKATFFICGNIGFANLETDPIAQRQLKRIVAEGHAIGSHTYAHKDLAKLPTDAELEQAFSQLDAIYKKILGPTAPVITTIRAPFGSPFQLDPEQTKRVAPVVTKYGVEVGWGMDPKDWSFDHFSNDPQVAKADEQAVIDAVQTLINNKQWGAILLHAVHLPSARALPTVITMLRNAGYHFISVEDVIRSEFGANSASIMAANKNALAAGTMPK